MEAFLKTAASLAAKVKAPAECEVECGVSIDNTQRAQFVKYLQNIKTGFASALTDKSVTVVQRCDIVYNVQSEKHQCRIFFSGPERLREEYMKKDLEHAVQSNDTSARRLSVSRETPLNREKIDDIVDVKLKLRYMFDMKYWRVECIALHKIERKSPEEIIARRQIYYKDPIRDIDAFIEFVSNTTYYFSGYRIEYELLAPANIMADLNDIIGEYNMIDKVIFGMEILALRYRDCVRKVASKYLHNSHTRDTIKQITPQARPLTYSDFNRVSLTGWFVSEKADGIHAVAYADDNDVFLLETVLHIYRDGGRNKYEAITGSAEGCYTIADGEYIAESRTFIIFDVMAIDGTPRHTEPFSVRVNDIGRAVELFAREFGLAENVADRITVVDKIFRLLPNPELKAELSPTKITYRETILRTLKDAESRPYKNDGLIFVNPANNDYMSTAIFKWKQGEHNTIDFLARAPSKFIDLRDRQPTKGMSAYLLYCSISSAQFGHLVHAVHYASMFDMNKFTTTKPVLFNPSIAPDLNLLTTERADLDGKIVELAPVWLDERGQPVDRKAGADRALKIGWRFVRIRSDRDGDLRSGKYFGNYYTNAEQTLLSFIYPITLDMLVSNQANEQYFVTDRDRMYESMAKFNNKIKAEMFAQYSHDVQYHLDLAGGRGSDIYNYFEHIAQKVFVVEVDQAAIQEMIDRKRNFMNKITGVSQQSPSGRYAGAQQVSEPFQPKRAKLPSLVIVEQDLRKPYEQIMAKLRMFGAPAADTQVVAGTALAPPSHRFVFDTISSHFAMHYFTRSDDEKINIVRLVNMCLKPGGHFIFTMFDAARVRKLITAGPWEFRLPDGRLKYSISRSDGYPETIKLVLPFTGGQAIEESLVDLDAIIRLFEAPSLGFTLVMNKNFSEFFDTYPKYTGRLDAGDTIFCGLYNVVVLRAKTT